MFFRACYRATPWVKSLVNSRAGLAYFFLFLLQKRNELISSTDGVCSLVELLVVGTVALHLYLRSALWVLINVDQRWF